MKHEMSLSPQAFNDIQDRRKDIEARLYDDKRTHLKLGDYITFSRRPDLAEKL